MPKSSFNILADVILTVHGAYPETVTYGQTGGKVVSGHIGPGRRVHAGASIRADSLPLGPPFRLDVLKDVIKEAPLVISKGKCLLLGRVEKTG